MGAFRGNGVMKLWRWAVIGAVGLAPTSHAIPQESGYVCVVGGAGGTWAIRCQGGSNLCMAVNEKGGSRILTRTTADRYCM
jgi:hypothetical protein